MRYLKPATERKVDTRLRLRFDRWCIDLLSTDVFYQVSAQNNVTANKSRDKTTEIQRERFTTKTDLLVVLCINVEA